MFYNYFAISLFMKNFNTILIVAWLFMAAILFVENAILAQQAYVLVWNTQAYVLVLASILTGFSIGYGTKWKFSESPNEEEDSYNF